MFLSLLVRPPPDNYSPDRGQWCFLKSDSRIIFRKKVPFSKIRFQSYFLRQNTFVDLGLENSCQNSKNIHFEGKIPFLWKYAVEIYNIFFEFQARDRKNINWFLLTHLLLHTRARARANSVVARSQFCAKSIRKVEQGRPGTEPSWAELAS